jgi:hypothetical protein
MSNRRTRRWVGGFGLAAASAAAIGMSTAHADDGSVPADIGLLNTAQTDIAEAFALSGHASADSTFFPELASIQTPLLTSDNSFVSGFGEALFNGPDQNLAQAGEAFLSAAQASSADPTDLAALGTYASDGFQVTDAIFGEIPSTLVGKLTDQIFDIGGFDTASASAATDLAASASSVATYLPSTAPTPADLLADATTNYTDASQLLGDIPSGSVGAYSPALASETEFDGHMLAGIANLDSAESALSSYGNGVLAELLNPVFTNIDQSWDSASQAALDATQALDGVVGSGSTADIGAALLAVSTSEYEALQPAIQAEFIDLGAHFLTGGDFTSLADLSAGLDPVAAAIDPSMFADLLSSIGL